MNKEMKDALALEEKRYPKAQVQDMVKLVVQSCLGVTHLHLDENTSLRMFEEEKKISKCDDRLPQYIGNGLCRVPLSYMKTHQLPLWNQLFMATMQYGKQDYIQFKETIAILHDKYDLSDEMLMKVDQGVHHSSTYQQMYQPHYRIIKQKYVDYFAAIVYVWNMRNNEEGTHLAIDGRCASGKSTLATILEEIFQIQVLHLDDYFVPSTLRSEQRTKEIGGNVDYERFQKEVLEPINKKETVYSKRYDCQRDYLCEATTIAFQPCMVWEGSYAHHPKFQATYARIFVHCDQSIQKARLKNRSPRMFERFIKEWIPMEEAYFKTYSIRECSDLVIDTSKF